MKEVIGVHDFFKNGQKFVNIILTKDHTIIKNYTNTFSQLSNTRFKGCEGICLLSNCSYPFSAFCKCGNVFHFFVRENA